MQLLKLLPLSACAIVTICGGASPDSWVDQAVPASQANVSETAANDEIWKYYQSTIQVHANVLQNLSCQADKPVGHGVNAVESG